MKNNDWRIRNQMEYLYQMEWIKSNYYTNQKEWDHDHCEFCMTKFDNTDVIAYKSKEGYYWICENCLKDFFNMFKWKIISK